MSNPVEQPKLPYFAPLLPWQADLWQQLTTSALETNSRLPHALLASGMAGIGKRAFIWRWVAWQLCQNRATSAQGACSHCESCNWLQAGTHPDLQILPAVSSPTFGLTAEAESNNKSKKSAKTTAKSSSPTIKIDDIRNIQNFVHQGSSGMRICVFDYAETMTIAAANALLKTLEEPRQGVQLILITDKPSLLLATIKSRVQQLPLSTIDNTQSQHYVQKHLSSTDTAQVEHLLKLSNYAPLQAIKMAKSDWYPQRKKWLNGWLALRSGARTTSQANEYWQKQLSLEDFLTLTQIMLADLQRVSSALDPYQQDIDFSIITANNLPDIERLHQLVQTLQTIRLSQKQNVQEQLAYDMLMQQIARL